MSTTRALDLLGASPMQRDTLLTPVLNAAVQDHVAASDTFDLALPERQSELLVHHGVPLTGTGLKAHPHPFHKTLETFTYCHTLRHLLHDGDTAVLFMKPEKFRRLQRLGLPFRRLLTQRLTPRDVIRYRDSEPLLFDEPQALLDYAGMFYEPADIASLFHHNPQLQTLIMPIVVPAESASFTASWFPEEYTFIIHDEDLVYYMEGSANGAYTQPRAAVNWLSVNEIRTPDFTISVALHSTLRSHHVLVLSRGSLPYPEKTRAFDCPDAVLLPQALLVDVPPSDRLVPRPVFDSFAAYVRAVRTLRSTDPAGYLRTQRNKPEYSWVTSAAWDNLQNFVTRTAPVTNALDHKLLANRWQALKAFVVRHKRAFIRFLMVNSIASSISVAVAIATSAISGVTVGFAVAVPVVVAALWFYFWMTTPYAPSVTHDHYKRLICLEPYRLTVKCEPVYVLP